MMKITLLLTILVSSFFSIGQRIAIEAEKYAFNEIYEWNGRGTILVNKDPNGLLRETNLTLVDAQGITKWQESFSPKVAEPFLISSAESKYLYYIDYLHAENGKMFYHQINESGSVKSSSFTLLGLFKDLGFNSVSDLELVDIINAKEALIFQFQTENKKEKVMQQVFVFMTHNNRLTYSTKVAPVSIEELENYTSGLLQYAGSSEKACYFSSKFKNSLQNGQRLIEFSPKAVVLGDKSYPLPKDELIATDSKAFSLTGAYYIKKKFDFAQVGNIVVNNGKVYLVGIKKKDLTPTIYCYTNDNQPYEIGTGNSITLEKKEIPSIGTILTKDGLLAQVSNNKSAGTLIVNGEKVTTIKSNAIVSEKIVLNPSILINQKFDVDFVHVIGNEIFTFDKKQLGIPGEVYLEKK